MDVQQVPQSLRNLLADILEIPADDVTASLCADILPAWDSFRHLQIVIAVESDYGVQLDPQRIPSLTSVAALQSELENKGVAF